MKDTRTPETAEIAQRFRALRKKEYLTQSRLAEIIGMARKSVSRIECGLVQPHHKNWDRFLDLEQRHCRPRVEMPTSWD